MLEYASQDVLFLPKAYDAIKLLLLTRAKVNVIEKVIKVQDPWENTMQTHSLFGQQPTCFNMPLLNSWSASFYPKRLDGAYSGSGHKKVKDTEVQRYTWRQLCDHVFE